MIKRDAKFKQSGLTFQTDLFIAPLDTMRHQSGSVTQFAIRRACYLRWGWSLLEYCTKSQITHEQPMTMRHFDQNWMESMLVRVHMAKIIFFKEIGWLSWKTFEFTRTWPLKSYNWVKYWPRIKNALPIANTYREQSAFFAKLHDTKFSKCAGRIVPPPLVHVGVMKKVRNRGLSWFQ